MKLLKELNVEMETLIRNKWELNFATHRQTWGFQGIKNKFPSDQIMHNVSLLDLFSVLF